MALAILISGCIKVDTSKSATVNNVDGFGFGYLYDINLKDGTHCIVFSPTVNGGGITCNWK